MDCFASLAMTSQPDLIRLLRSIRQQITRT
jgi:hypothetical protein